MEIYQVYVDYNGKEKEKTLLKKGDCVSVDIPVEQLRVGDIISDPFGGEGQRVVKIQVFGEKKG